MSRNKTAFIEFMMDAGVLRFGDFTTKSGRKTPYFINTGNYKTGRQIATLGQFYADRIRDICGDGFDAIFGPAYKGIPLATSVAAALATQHQIDKPFFFNRKEEKDHGEGGCLVGYQPADGDRIIIVEDVITAGTAIREVMPILKGCGDITVRDMFISVDRCEVGTTPGKTAVMQVHEQFGLRVHSLVTVRDIYHYLKNHPDYAAVLPLMEQYMATYCIL